MRNSIRRLSFLVVSIAVLSASLPAAAALVDGKPTMNKPGTYVWRDGSDNWHVRMVAGLGMYYFNGSLKAMAPFDYVQNASIESNDVVEQTWPALVSLKMNAANYNMDGFDFSIPNNKGLCFRGSGTDGGSAMLGSAATPIATPADLLWSGACDGDATSASLKYHPGHYVALPPQDDRSMIINMVGAGIQGVVIRYYWKELEPSYGKYNFSEIAADLQVATDHGMRLIVLIEDKTFKPEKATPSYLWSNGNTLPQKNGNGYIAARWKPYVAQRMQALLTAMGNRFDSEPYFEGVTFQETATGVTEADKKNNGYTPEKYRDAIISVLETARDSFPTSQILWCMNFLEGKQAYIGEIAERVAPLGIGMGGPDVLIENASLKMHTYPYYAKYQNQMPLFGSMQYDSYRHLRSGGSPTKYYRMWEMYNFARDTLHVNYIFWTRAPKKDPGDSYEYLDAKPVITNNPLIND